MQPVRLGLLAAALMLVAQARAQTVNPGALDALTPARPAQPAAPRPAAPRPATSNPATSRAVPPTNPAASNPAAPRPPAQRPAPARPPATRPPTVPVAPPAVAAIPPAVAVPVARPVPPQPVVVAADAPGEASPIPGGMRVTFGADRTDLNPVTEPALRNYARGIKANEQATINVVATAAGSPDDPSTTRRLSLSRALAVRAVLIGEGIASTRIYVRALGATGPAGPPDRVDLTSGGAAGAAP